MGLLHGHVRQQKVVKATPSFQCCLITRQLHEEEGDPVPSHVKERETDPERATKGKVENSAASFTILLNR